MKFAFTLFFLDFFFAQYVFVIIDLLSEESILQNNLNTIYCRADITHIEKNAMMLNNLSYYVLF